MRKLIVFSLVAILATGCTAQNKKGSDLAQNKEKAVTKPPKGKWEVHKEMDANGNLIRYDSIYSWSSSNQYKDLSKKEMDSVNQSFNSLFEKHFSNMQGMEFPKSLQQDSLFTKDFFNFNSDFFQKHFGAMSPNMDEVLKHMEQMQREFMENNHSNFLFPEETDSIKAEKNRI